MSKKFKNTSGTETSMTPVVDGVVRDILMSYDIYRPEKSLDSFLKQRMEREMADRFDFKAELERVKKIRNEMNLSKND